MQDSPEEQGAKSVCRCMALNAWAKFRSSTTNDMPWERQKTTRPWFRCRTYVDDGWNTIETQGPNSPNHIGDALGV